MLSIQHTPGTSWRAVDHEGRALGTDVPHRPPADGPVGLKLLIHPQRECTVVVVMERVLDGAWRWERRAAVATLPLTTDDLRIGGTALFLRGVANGLGTLLRA
jgi:hypothetical protein